MRPLLALLVASVLIVACVKTVCPIIDLADKACPLVTVLFVDGGAVTVKKEDLGKEALAAAQRDAGR